MSSRTCPISINSRTRFRPEEDLVLASTRTRLSAETSAELEGRLRRPLDWEYVLTVAGWHGVNPLLYRQLTAVPPDLVPGDVRERLKASVERTRRRNLFLSLQLSALVRSFAAEGIPSIPYKGPTLAALAYGDLGLREFADLDVLVKRDDVLRARTILTAEGYRSASRLSEAQERALVKSQHAYAFVRADGVQVELHWEISPRHVSGSAAPERLWERLWPVTLTGTTMYTLSPDVLVTSLCEHATKHLWERVGWICDIAELTQAPVDLDWTRVVAEARRTAGERTLLLGLQLAHDLLGAPMPAEMRQAAESDAALPALVNEVRARLFRDHDRPTGLLEQARFHLRVRGQWRQRLRYCWLALTTLTVADWERRRLPRGLSFLHYPMRLLRLVGGAYEHRHR